MDYKDNHWHCVDSRICNLMEIIKSIDRAELSLKLNDYSSNMKKNLDNFINSVYQSLEDEIELIKISNVRRKFHFPFLKIDFNNGNKSRTYFLTKFISEKSIDKLRWALRSLKIKED